jgi:hypothetical protein
VMVTVADGSVAPPGDGLVGDESPPPPQAAALSRGTTARRNSLGNAHVRRMAPPESS